MFLGNLRRAVLCVAVFASCASPPPTAPSAGQVAGAWIANAMLSSVSGGECLGDDLGKALGRRDVLLAALAGQSAIDATITSQGNGTSCEYTGTNASGALSLTMTRCQSARVVNVPCSAGGRRDVQLVTATLQARADSRLGTGSGSEVAVWSVSDSATRQPVGLLNLTTAFTWVFLGLPPD